MAAFKEKHAELAKAAIRRSGFPADKIEVHVGRTPELIEGATCCLAVSGSVSLELLHHAKPTAILYRVSRLMFWIQKFFRRVRYITLVNLLTTDELFPEEVGIYTPGDPADEHVLMPEYLSCEDCSGALAGHAVGWLRDAHARESLVYKLENLREEVGGGGASRRAAAYLFDELGACAGHSSAA